MDEVRVSREPDRERASRWILLLAFTACLSVPSSSLRVVVESRNGRRDAGARCRERGWTSKVMVRNEGKFDVHVQQRGISPLH
jgi:hypothetical protein